MATPIAIVGIGCRFPGGLSDATSFWNALAAGVNAVTEIPPSRADFARWYDPRAATPGRMMTKFGGFLERLEEFDASFFEIAPRVAAQLDPQQRLLMETAWESLEDAGCDARALRGTRTGVYVGEWINDYEMRLFADPEAVDFFATLGTGRYAASGRISYALDLRGPSITIDTACSSSLVAVHGACQAIRAGECDIALAGGANTILEPHISIAYSQSRMMAQDGRCKFGDAAGDGYVRSEGAAMIVLKPLARAREDGDRIYAVIRGSASNNDGVSSGSMGTPSREGQEALLRSAYENAGISPTSVQYVEAHGTGTRAGDPVEIGAIADVLAPGRSPSQRVYIGSVKTNVGHTEGAAGVAGLIKVALALHHGEIPASLHLSTPNPLIPWADLPFEIPRATTAWPGKPGTRTAGVSAFGIAGTNAHVVLEEAPPVLRARVTHGERAFLLPISAAAPAALAALAAEYAELVERGSSDDVHDVCACAALHRTALAHRAVFAAETRAELADRLRRFAAGDSGGANASGHAAELRALRIAFAFPGQGSEWTGMARELMVREPVFRDAIAQCDAALRRHVSWSLTEQLERGAPSTSMAIIQPTLLAVEIALAALWRSFGVEPIAFVGHSMGEAGAAYVAGAISLDDAMAVIATRSALMETVAGTGGMALTELSADEATARIAPFAGRIGIAVTSGPRSTVVSGDADAIESFVALLTAEGVFCRRLESVSVASHSAHMDPLVPRLVERVGSLRASSTSVPLYSTVDARAVDGSTLGATYWGRNLREPVRFAETVQAMTAAGIDAIVELSPHPVLLKSMRGVLAVGSLRRDEPEQANAYASLGALWTAGHPVDWRRLYPAGYNRIDLPHYAWQRERYWTERPGARDDDSRVGDHPLLGRAFRPARSDETLWQTTVQRSRVPFLSDHSVRGAVIMPAAAYCEAAIAAARAERDGDAWLVQDMHFDAALALSASDDIRMQVSVHWLDDKSGDVAIHAKQANDEDWTLHAAGRLRATDRAESASVMDASNTPTALVRDDVYATFESSGLEYGATFALLDEVRVSETTLRAKVTAPGEGAGAGAASYTLYPPALDAALQAIALLAVRAKPGVTPIPQRIERLQVNHAVPVGETFAIQATLGGIDGDVARGDVVVTNSSGDVAVVATGVAFNLTRAGESGIDNQLFVPAWREIPASASTNLTAPARVLVLAGAAKDAEPVEAALRANGIAVTVFVTNASFGAGFELAVHEFAGEGLERSAIIDVHALHLDERKATVADAFSYAADNLAALARALASVDVRTPPRVWVITQRAVSARSRETELSTLQAPALGFTRAWMHEDAKFATTLVDIDGDMTALAGVVASGIDERQLAIRGGAILAARLVAHEGVAKPVRTATPSCYRATMEIPGVPDQLRWEACDRVVPGPAHVEIEIAATGLNFMNLMSVLGVYPGYPRGQGPLGIECSGRVVRVGHGVTRFAEGDRVVAMAPDALSSHVVAHEALVARIPDGVEFETAAGFPIAFLTAWYALHTLARITAGDRVLIHSAAGGVGLAAMQIARNAGAEIHATASTAEKRDLLTSLGAKGVYGSRGGGFDDAILAATNGEGVDIVLNSLAGSAIPAGLRVLRPHGRFVELGKRDIYGDASVALAPFRKNLSFFAVDLDRMMRERPTELGRVFAEVVDAWREGHLTPLPTRVFPADSVAVAFQEFAPGTHTGKFVVAHAAPPSFVGAPIGRRFAVRDDATYVITGGHGALGSRVAQWLVERGAGCVVLVGREAHGDSTNAAAVRSYACDVRDADAVARMFADIRQTCPPIRGVFHAAGVLSDAPASSITTGDVAAVASVKVAGAEHLQRATAGDTLDAFVLFSSIASVFGTPGQASYAAGNAYLDTLAHARRQRGLAATAINFGPVRDAGLAAASRVRGVSLARLGFDGIDAARVVDAIDALLAAGTTQAVCASFDVARWQNAMASLGDVAFASELTGTTQGDTGREREIPLAEQLRAAPAGQPRRAVMELMLRTEVGAVLRIPAARVAADRPLKSLGLDSLMALELRNRLERRAGVALTPSLALNHPTVAAIAAHLAERMGIDLDATRAESVDTHDDAADELRNLLEELENLSDEEARDLLAREK